MVLAAAPDSHLRPLTSALPKPMVPVFDRPLVAHVVDLCRRQGFDRLIANLHSFPEAIRDYFGDALEYRHQEQAARHGWRSARRPRLLCQLRGATFDALAGKVAIQAPGETVAGGVRVAEGACCLTSARFRAGLDLPRLPHRVRCEADGSGVIGAESRIGDRSALRDSIVFSGTTLPAEPIVLRAIYGQTPIAQSLRQY
jgi:NDP-sugar pyrophosphorylase family protein